MPQIVFSKADILRSQIMEAQWASFEITNVVGPVKNSAGDGYNWTVHFTLIDYKINPDNNGKEFKRVFSSKALGMMIPLVAAVEDVSVDTYKDAFNYDTDKLKGRKVDGKISVDMYEGRANNKVEEYLPYTKGVNMQPAY